MEESDDKNKERVFLFKPILEDSYFRHSLQNTFRQNKILKSIVSMKRIPDYPLDDLTIRSILNVLASMDSNNFDKASVGEREGRVFSNLVKERNFYFAHGIGRSGDVAALQPKAIGSSTLYRLTNLLILSLIKCEIPSTKECIVLPFATGMALSFCYMTLKSKSPRKQYVLMPRIDQKTCLKSIVTSGLSPLIIEPNIDGDELVTNIQTLENTIRSFGAENILAIVSTTSCFAPRAPDSVVLVAELCKRNNIAHVVNNAYGLQCDYTSKCIERAIKTGRVDSVVISTDKNFMVPVGGSVVFSPTSGFIEKLSEMYPGRASLSPILDLFITLISMGKCKYTELKQNRADNFAKLKQLLQQVAKANGERVLETSGNTISMAITLNCISVSPSRFGSMLYNSFCFGARAVSKNTEKKVCGITFKGYGAHYDDYKNDYLSCAVGIGSMQRDIDVFIKRLEKCFKKSKTKTKAN